MLCDPMDYNPLGSSFYGLLKHDYWSGLPFLSPWDLPDPGIKPVSPALQADSLPSEPPGNPTETDQILIFIAQLLYVRHQ